MPPKREIVPLEKRLNDFLKNKYELLYLEYNGPPPLNTIYR